MSEVIWFKRLDGQGEESLDLHTCRRFVLADIATIKDENDQCVIFYLTTDGRWVRRYGFVGDEGGRLYRCDVFREVHPVIVVYELAHLEEYLTSRNTDGWTEEELRELGALVIPSELKQYLEFTDDERFRKWEEVNSARVTPTWDRENKTLSLRGRLCKKYRGIAKNQFKLLDAFELAGWPESIREPFGARGQTIQTVKDFNDSLPKPHPLWLTTNGFRVRWRYQMAGVSLP
jgi:hypothetical protein